MYFLCNLSFFYATFPFVLNPFPHDDTFWCPWETSLLKTLWEKEKLLIMSNFSFTPSVFYPFRELSGIFIKFKIVLCILLQFGQVYNLSSSNGLTLYQTTKFFISLTWKLLLRTKHDPAELIEFDWRGQKISYSKYSKGGNFNPFPKDQF